MLGAPQVLVLWINNQVNTVRDRVEASWCACDLSWIHLGTVSGLNRNYIRKVPEDLVITYALISKNNRAYTLITLVSGCIHCKLSSLQLSFCFLMFICQKPQTISREYIVFPSYILQVKHIKSEWSKQWWFGQSCWVNQGSVSEWRLPEVVQKVAASTGAPTRKDPVNPSHKCLLSEPSVRHHVTPG